MLSLPDVALAELVGSAFDFVWIDLEHGALGPRDAQALAIAANAAGCAALVRLPAWRSDCLPAILDAGVDGIVAPRIETAPEAAGLVDRLRYPPAGTRGFGPRRAGGYGRTRSFWRSPAAELACVVQIETPAGVDAAADIAATDGVDAIVVGCADLSLTLGVAQDLRCDAVVAALGAVESAAREAGVAFGIAASADAETIAEVAGEVATMVVYSADVRLYSQAVDDAAQGLAKALTRAAALDV